MNAITTRSRPVRIDSAGVSLNGDLTMPDPAIGMVVFVHGSGSSRFSRRNRAVAEVLTHAQLGTLLTDLLTEAEERTDAVTVSFDSIFPCWPIGRSASSTRSRTLPAAPRYRWACSAPARAPPPR
jgi:hypothetical protein